MLQYSCLENRVSDREAWQATVYRVAKSQTQPKQPCRHRCKTFFACGNSALVRVENEGGVAAWLVETLASVQGHRLPPLQELWPYQHLFSSLLFPAGASCSLQSEGLFGLFISSPVRHLEGSLAWGPSLLFGVSGILKRPPGCGPTP